MASKENQSNGRASAALDASTLRPLRGTEGPLYTHVYRRLAHLIDSGALVEGARLPTSRFLAGQLAVSRATVAYAYNLLSADGYITGRGRAGTFVRSSLARRDAVAAQEPAPPVTGGVPMFSVGLAPVEFFPRKVWVNLVKRRVASLSLADLLPGDPQGSLPLRRALANRLAITRGVACTPDQVFITAGMAGATALTARAMVEKGQRVLVEDPADPRCFEALQAAGAQLVPVVVDAQGMRIEERLAAYGGPRLAVVTPCCQFPLGVALSERRRRRLLEFAFSGQGYVFEHDIQTDFRFAGPAPRALAGEAGAAGVIYALHLSEILFPALGISCVCVPPELVGRFRAACEGLAAVSSPAEQAALMDLVRRGHILRYFAASHAACARRREALRDAFSAIGARVHVPDAGLHLIVSLRKPPAPSALASLREHGLAPVPLSHYCHRPDSFPPALAVGFASVPEARAGDAARLLAQYVELDG